MRGSQASPVWQDRSHLLRLRYGIACAESFRPLLVMATWQTKTAGDWSWRARRWTWPPQRDRRTRSGIWDRPRRACRFVTMTKCVVCASAAKRDAATSRSARCDLFKPVAEARPRRKARGRPWCQELLATASELKRLWSAVASITLPGLSCSDTRAELF